MNDVAELKHFALTHARAQNLGDTGELLARITSDEGEEPGSWAGEWRRRGDALHARGRLLDAVRHYNMARFPGVDGPARRGAADAAVRAFAHWAADHGVERLEVGPPGERVACWAAGLSRSAPRPLVLVCGGIVSPKEQWAPALSAIRRAGLAGVVTEMPGVGENQTVYGPQSWRLFPRLLDAVADRADVARSCAMALSFSGHLALRAAAEDPRIRGVVTAGAPVSAFFTDEEWIRALPRVTVDALARLSRTTPDRLTEVLSELALSSEELAALRIPVAYSASLRDEIVPAADLALLRRHVRDLRVVAHDDVHGAPSHVAQTRVWALLNVVRLQRGPGVRTALLAAVLAALRALPRRP
ncbi:alpha/beta hydrolase [Streptomyces sp. NPDC059740]|uniref:alpha/beta hydrolase n=1 Tax=Streptomyces sp. NPDC059740 TaxID=3346926 RepID=UPI00365796AB